MSLEPKSKIIWDLPTRATHWLVALVVICNLFVIEEGDPPHKWLGYLAVLAIAFRFFWGFNGGSASRWKSFDIHPKSIFNFIKNNFHEKQETEGHNPLAAIAYVSIWLIIVGLGVTGWMMGLDAYFGEEWLEEIHEQLANILKLLLIIHLLGVFTDAFRFKRKTWLRMITGKKL